MGASAVVRSSEATASAIAPTAPLLRGWGITALGPTPVALSVGHLVNQASPIPSWWANADPDLTIEAYTPSGTIAQLQPGQSVILGAIWTRPSVGAAAGQSEPRWTVNSPDATLTVESGYASFPVQKTAPPGTVDSATVLFSASRPGIYAIRAQWDGRYSVPLVLTVGFSELPRPRVMPRVAANNAGVATVAANLLHRDPVDMNAVQTAASVNRIKWPSLWIGQPVDGWIPITGQVPRTWLNPAWSHTVTVILSHPTASHDNVATYVLPLNANGTVSGVVASPWAGNISLMFQPSAYATTLKGVQSAERLANVDVWTQLTVNRPASLASDLVATASLDYNDTRFLGAIRTAATLWYNAPDRETAAVAISNWVATHIAYNYPEYDDKAWVIGATASQTAVAQLGVCQDYAEVLAALYRALGLPTAIADGVVSYVWEPGWTPNTVRTLTREGLTHAWVEVWALGPTPLVTDPTWDGGSPASLLGARYLTNNYTTVTTIYRGTHFEEGVEPNQIP
ncbi:MAG: transglutaminase-like domain-containing protein [Firmicutes bacterium]|nr:transglutaminase-like domain-containing protein [Bacillota bacterium]